MLLKKMKVTTSRLEGPPFGGATHRFYEWRKGNERPVGEGVSGAVSECLEERLAPEERGGFSGRKPKEKLFNSRQEVMFSSSEERLADCLPG